MACADASFPQGRESILWQLQKAQGVGYHGSAFPKAPCQLFLGDGKLVLEFLQGARLFGSVEILALKVFYKGDKHHILVAQILQEHRNLTQVSQLGSAPAALSGNNLVLAFFPASAHKQWLNDSLQRYGFGKLLKPLVGHALPWLIRVRDQSVNGDIEDLICAYVGVNACRLQVRREEGIKPATKSFGRRHCLLLVLKNLSSCAKPWLQSGRP